MLDSWNRSAPITVLWSHIGHAVVPVLSVLERCAARGLGSATAVADSKQTLICSYLSAAVQLGLILENADQKEDTAK